MSLVRHWLLSTATQLIVSETLPVTRLSYLLTSVTSAMLVPVAKVTRLACTLLGNTALTTMMEVEVIVAELRLALVIVTTTLTQP